MSEKKRELFTVKVDDQELELAVERPSEEALAEAQKVYNKAFAEAVASKAILRPEVERVLKDRDLWNQTRQDEHDTLQKQITEQEKKLTLGGMKFKEAVDLAYKIIDDRRAISEMRSVRNSLDGNTAEAQAENARFNRLVSLCTVYADEGNKYFQSYKDYLDKADSEVATTAATKLAFIVYKLDPDFQANQPEYKFLRKYKMVDKELRLINKDGKWVDRKGKLIDKEGRYVDEQGRYLDKDGNLIDKSGNIVAPPGEEQPFLDDYGNPIPDPSPA